MGRFQTFQEFLTTQSIRVPLAGYMVNLVLSAILSFILSYVYVKYGTSLSNRRMFAKNFMLITMVTMLVITIVKSSLALSLGLVGALSIVRFRAAIKEPEELSYLFFAIAIGLGFGAGQCKITITAFIIIVGMIILKIRFSKFQDNQNLYLTVTSHVPGKITLEQIVEILKECSQVVNMKRFDETKNLIEASFLLEFSNFKELNKAKSKLQRIDDSIKITFLDNKGVL
ncbi:DUF4956 domain-containing protein [bacterium]|nr:DUF4956 domain-containing protein [bacterium]